MQYVDCWATFTGYPTISRWDLDTDTEPLFGDAVKVLCLKPTVYELTSGDEEAAGLLVSAPVDEIALVPYFRAFHTAAAPHLPADLDFIVVRVEQTTD